MRELLIATRNEGKVPEFQAALAGLPVAIRTLDQTSVPTDYTVEEPGNTYEAHAAIKAILYGKKSGLLTLADDSGLEVDALQGWPSVHSATWKEGSDKDRLEGLLNKMKDVLDENRGAQFRSTIAIFDPETDRVRFAEGTCRGHILREATGSGGFGYDPVFLSEDLLKTFGEAPEADKNRVSHRARALQKARVILESEFV